MWTITNLGNLASAVSIFYCLEPSTASDSPTLILINCQCPSVHCLWYSKFRGWGSIIVVKSQFYYAEDIYSSNQGNPVFLMHQYSLSCYFADSMISGKADTILKDDWWITFHLHLDLFHKLMANPASETTLFCFSTVQLFLNELVCQLRHYPVTKVGSWSF